MGPTTEEKVSRLAGNLLASARSKRGLSQRELARRAAVPQAMIARIESHRQQPSLPTLYRLLAAAELELRTRLADYDDHDDVLDARRRRRTAAERKAARKAQDEFAAALAGRR
ncbi:MAG TPA: helix-turn-helix domain-containing protein [Mycobacteriales bacterium]|nr:helix-turn-helix domain-containing protein [Mycobacteriales bacterium]